MSSGPTPMTIDFKKVPEHRQHASGKIMDPNIVRPRTPDGKLLTAKQIRARARRRAKRAGGIMTDEEFNYMFKPVDEWDLQELSRGRPRNHSGTFAGPKPKWISQAVHERSMELFKQAIRTNMNSATPDAMNAILMILHNEEVDEKGRPIIPPSTKLDAAKFLLEHVVGKPTVRLETDLSVKLQGILGVVMANPADALMPPIAGGEGYTVGHLPGVTMPMMIEGQGMTDEEVDFSDTDGPE